MLPATAAPLEAEAVLDTPGDGRTCWCQWFRLPRREFDGLAVEERRDRFRKQARTAAPGPGVVATRDGEPVGWCAVAPLDEYPVVGRTRLFGGRDVPPGTWAVTCFVVPRQHRRQGVAGMLLDAAVAHARAHAAVAVEAYPVDVAAKARTGAADLYHGPLSLFTSRGFEVVSRPSPTRALVRLGTS